jgi:pantoate--beta-alanine ligase
MARDLELCSECGVDVVFSPDPSEVYMPSHSIYVEETELSMGLCGASRPSHFRGVTTVVCKLFNMILPDIAVFGQKDAQQVRVIQRMARDLNFPVDIVVCPTVREADGRALSSRNTYLSPEQREQAACLYSALMSAVSLHEKGERKASALVSAMRLIIEGQPEAKLDYVEIVDLEHLTPLDDLEGDILIALAVRIGQTRLIDNVVIRSEA